MRDKKRADLDTDRTLGLATRRCLEIVGEAASHIPESLRQQHPQLPWPQIIGTRNRNELYRAVDRPALFMYGSCV